MKRERRGGAESDSDRVNAFGEDTGKTRQQREFVRAAGEFVREFPWTHIATLTFQRPQHPEKALKEFKAFVRELERRTQARVDYLPVIENTRRGESHIHALLNLHNDLDCSQIGQAWEGNQRVRGRPQEPQWKPIQTSVDEDVLDLREEMVRSKLRQEEKAGRPITRGWTQKPRKRKEWKRGRSEVEVYDPEKGFAYYITKHVDGDLDTEWYLDGLPEHPVAA